MFDMHHAFCCFSVLVCFQNESEDSLSSFCKATTNNRSCDVHYFKQKHAEKSQSEGYAVPAFNIHNLETLQELLRALHNFALPLCWREHPVISLWWRGKFNFVSTIAGSRVNLPLVLHLDHHEESDDIFNRFAQGSVLS